MTFEAVDHAQDAAVGKEMDMAALWGVQPRGTHGCIGTHRCAGDLRDRGL